MRPKLRVHTVSLGCPKNRVDTERLLGALGQGLIPVDDPAEADLVLVNTCGFIAPAIEESVAAVLQAARDIDEAEGGRQGRRPVLAVAGCLVSRFGEDLTAELPEVDLWLSTHELDQWPARAAAALGRTGFPGATDRVLSTGPGMAYLKVGEGCSHDCRFCTIPAIRGPHVSRTLDAIEADARAMLDAGARELVVVGQDVTAWGSDLGVKHGLERLVERLLPLPGLDWLRLMYLYPAGLTEARLDFLAAAGPPLVPYFDIPLQHAHPEVLAAMGRPFAKDPNRVLERLHRRFAEPVKRTSLITGYPGETDAHFRELLAFIERWRFHHLGVFAYCAEEGTPAAELPGRVDEALREERRERAMALQRGISAELLEGFVGAELDVLVERPSPEWPGLFEGRAWFQAPEVDGVTYVSASPESGRELRPGDLVRAEVVQATEYDLSALA